MSSTSPEHCVNCFLMVLLKGGCPSHPSTPVQMITACWLWCDWSQQSSSYCWLNDWREPICFEGNQPVRDTFLWVFSHTVSSLLIQVYKGGHTYSCNTWSSFGAYIIYAKNLLQQHQVSERTRTKASIGFMFNLEKRDRDSENCMDSAHSHDPALQQQHQENSPTPVQIR